MLQDTTARVELSTPPSINQQIQAGIRDSVRWHASHPERIDERLHELDQEWDVERVLEANAATLALSGAVLAATVDRRWLAVPAVVTSFLLQHAIQGWCPPLPILRHLGFRTAREIESERTALKAIRGDFIRVHQAGGNMAEAALAGAQR